MSLSDGIFRKNNKCNQKVSQSVLDDLKWFLDLNYIPEDLEERATGILFDAEEEKMSAPIKSAAPEDLPMPMGRPYARRSERSDACGSLFQKIKVDVEDTFQQELLRQIDRRGLTDAQVYKKAGLDRKLFSKIRCNRDYKPSRLTALSLALALELNLDETADLLSRAGLALSPSSLSDMIIKYCIVNRIYDLYEVNSLLYEYDQQLLGC